MGVLDERCYARLVWRTPDGAGHPQWTAYKDAMLCRRCGKRHRLSEAAVMLCCPGVAHIEGVRPCVLCGLSWQVPEPDVWPITPDELAAQYVLEEGPGLQPGDFTRPEPIVTLVPPRAACVYCMVLEGPQHSTALAHHRAGAHPEEDH